MRTPSEAVQKWTSCCGGAGEESPCLPGFPVDVTAPTKRKPFRDIVRTSRCCPPLSPTALRTALMRLSSVESDTIRPFQTDAIKSSLLTTRSRFSTRWTRTSKTWGSTGIVAPPARNSRRSLSSAKSSNKNSTLLPPQQTAATISQVPLDRKKSVSTAVEYYFCAASLVRQTCAGKAASNQSIPLTATVCPSHAAPSGTPALRSP